ncbi:MAG: hypothetical protein WBJ36_02360 [Tenuifilum sp.]|uniref:hypothetical protein n=1 Tax=Tenuifilum TaxID=2760873 RepID=UPI0009CA61A2|nr:hypothetical protein [Bacteroidales bacterium]MBP9029210.1 hypothetical protein [Bacteroidales bacterium]OPX82744.1 MAG: hypothetical protein A4E52_02021 [Pelotomaculum sp. PtaB.Bin013]
MKKYLTIILVVFFASCKAQNNESTVDFFSLVKNPDYIWTTSYSIEKEDDVTAIYYEFYMKDVHVGQGCIYAISKQFPEKWTIKAVEDPNGNCGDKKNYKPLFYINCAARNFFTENKEELIQNFDVYTFFVDKTDLEGPYKETSESGSAEYYNEKSDSEVIIYKYESGSWVEKGKQKLGDEIPRTFGSKYIEKLAKERIK